ncbi:SRS domain-containing protein [Neospora caninum Liverpool]|uniref:SRS domain-containing protein n=1 Tax=Neospora caninum (strain Liverpool) TaxID=572307 RepID=F0VMJ8_NEOCL|nr:SRS domain-containing protein [Neospora caninum Liverpool]CBZ54944.1 SRS domain-containing protein [Neospora caninum Liverpool]CEL69666.1 TPA: SRS domain-containing protein [Neospora caninum Liverpool]|eukprot:XP_003884972.1 SRS domain-containing protein [Neospora caninum Liverpool]
MQGPKLGGFEVSKGLRYKLSASILVGLACLTGCAAVASGPISCTGSNKFAAVSLEKQGSQVELQCPDSSTLVPEPNSHQFCQNAACTARADLTKIGVWHEVDGEVLTPSRQKTDGYILTLSVNPKESKTLYFQCRQGTKQRGGNIESGQEERTEVTCTFQVAVHGSQAATTAAKEGEPSVTTPWPSLDFLCLTRLSNLPPGRLFVELKG